MKCPYCNSKLTTVGRGPTPTYKNISVYFFECLECHECFAYTKHRMTLEQIPFMDASATFPERVRKLSPNAFKVYNDCLKAHSLNLDDFAGMGLRKALEWLLWDYFISFKMMPIVELKKLNLHGMISKLNNDAALFYSKICADILRVFGNEVVHIHKSTPTLNISDAFFAIEKLCSLIDSEMRLIETNKQLTQRKKNLKG